MSALLITSRPPVVKYQKVKPARSRNNYKFSTDNNLLVWKRNPILVDVVCSYTVPTVCSLFNIHSSPYPHQNWKRSFLVFAVSY